MFELAVVNEPSPNVASSHEFVTPALAKQMLKSSARNRALSSALVKKYKHEMEIGQWQPHASVIYIDSGGNLIDGQHRLRAVIESGMGQWFIVSRGIAPSAFHIIDRGKRRSVADMLSVMGEKNCNVMAALLSGVARFRRDPEELGMAGGVLGQPTVAEMFKVLADDSDGVRWAVAISNRYRMLHFIPQSVVATMAYLCSKMSDKETAEEFLRSITEGDGLTKGSPEFLFRKRLFSQKPHAKLAPRVMYALFVKTWNSWINGIETKQIKWSVAGKNKERFPRLARANWVNDEEES